MVEPRLKAAIFLALSFIGSSELCHRQMKFCVEGVESDQLFDLLDPLKTASASFLCIGTLYGWSDFSLTMMSTILKPIRQVSFTNGSLNTRIKKC